MVCPGEFSHSLSVKDNFPILSRPWHPCLWKEDNDSITSQGNMRVKGGSTQIICCVGRNKSEFALGGKFTILPQR